MRNLSEIKYKFVDPRVQLKIIHAPFPSHHQWVNPEQFEKFHPFYPSAYLCPFCNNMLLKTVLNPGDEFGFRLDNIRKVLIIKRAFICLKEGLLFFAYPGNNLSTENNGTCSFFVKQTEKGDIIFDALCGLGTTAGRTDANEFLDL